MYPRIMIDLKKLTSNTKLVTDLCASNDIDVMAVTKVFCAVPEIAQAYLDGGVKYLADSRIENLIKLQSFDCEKVLLRLPMISQSDDVVRYADISLNSEIETIKALNHSAQLQNKIHQIILMIDLGDLREGILPKDLFETIEAIKAFESIHLKGIGVNLTCYGGVIPTPINLGQLVDFSNDIKEKYNLNLEMISGGNSSSYYLLTQDKLPKGITNLRFGELLVLGRETAYGEAVEGMYDDVFVFESEIVELKEKASVPIGEIGMNAFGKVPTFEDKGQRLRGILAAGVQDLDPENLMPLDDKIQLLGASSDHMIWDLTDSDKAYKVGDVLQFKVSYGAILSLFTSEYIKKEYKS